jgi:hypothetical protein
MMDGGFGITLTYPFLFSGFPKLKIHADLFTMVKAGLASWKMAGASVCFMYPLAAYTYLCF